MHTLRLIGLCLACFAVACDGTSPDAQRVDQLTSRLEALEKRLAATQQGVEPLDRLRDEVASLDRRMSSLETSVRELAGRPAAGTTAAPPAPPVSPPARSAPPPREPSGGPAAWGPTTRQDRAQRRAELRALTDEFRARLSEMREDRSNVGNQEKTREILDWYRDQRRSILRGEGRTDQ
jgi:septal ring factor EnvC (AmiA/AmiB activator)